MPTLKRGGTKLSVIDKHELFVMCNCGHAESVWVRDIIKVLGDAVSVGFAIDKMRCSRFHTKNVKEYRITIQADLLMRCGRRSRAGRVGNMTGEGRAM